MRREAFSTDRPPASEGPTILARRYQLAQDLGDIPQGRRFLADDLQRDRKVLLLVFNREFLSRQQTIHRAGTRDRPPPARASAGIAGNLLAREYWPRKFPGPGDRHWAALVEILRVRKRAALSPEALLAAQASRAGRPIMRETNRLQQVALTISGVHLTTPGLTEEAITPALLQRPLTQWSQLGVKVEPVDFSLSSSDSATWAGSATLVQSSSGEGPRASYLGMLSLLIYELLGGPQKNRRDDRPLHANLGSFRRGKHSSCVGG